jgi:Amt family ammonium transporter
MTTFIAAFAALMVFFMQAGFMMAESGFTRAKNASGIIEKTLMGLALSVFAYFFVGQSLMYAGSGAVFGLIRFGAEAAAPAAFSGIETGAFALLGMGLCAMSVAMISGAMAERTKFFSYVTYVLLVALAVYPVAGRWIWADAGWLKKMGFHDLGGAAAVNLVGGWCALIGAAMVGPRVGKYRTDGSVNALPGHSLPLGALGVMIMWICWLALNAGMSLGGMSGMSDIIIHTMLAASASAVAAMVVTRLRYGKPDIPLTLNGALTGLVAITAGADVVSPGGAAAIGLIAGISFVFLSEFVERVLKVDDPVGASSVHLGCGAIGVILTGFFATGAALEDMAITRAMLIGVQALGAATVSAFAALAAFVILFVLNKTVGLRVEKQKEEMGLDISEHGVNAYADFITKP